MCIRDSPRGGGRQLPRLHLRHFPRRRDGQENEATVEGLREVVDNVNAFGGAPVLLGFGISRPEHVRAAIQAGAAGAITGSAITKIIDAHVVDTRIADMDALKRELTEYVAAMKDATIAS